MNDAEKNSIPQTELSVIRAGLSTMLNSLPSEDRLEFLSKSLREHPRVAMVTVITEEELHDYYVRGNREL